MGMNKWHIERRSSFEAEYPLARESSNVSETGSLSFVVLGASGDLTKKKTFPALFHLYRAELEAGEERYDVIVGDYGGLCYKLYTKSFYQFTVKPRLKEGGPARIFSHNEVFSLIYNTLRQVFKYVPSYADIWRWVMASDFPLELNAEEIYLRMRQRIKGENRYLDGKTFSSASTLGKVVRNSLDNELMYTQRKLQGSYMAMASTLN
ncbi:thermospermine synthase ACAULIS5-like [Arachis stenosperma]|uniref:thermospermine synthase ACAULIS5-like n=1 Tax=Arachis stenosperma TaxID=217475 RepID=UPI0025AD8FAF|nr:thermospermine synthase ACAULIS5-like [Arachis stenosperma]